MKRPREAVSEQGLDALAPLISAASRQLRHSVSNTQQGQCIPLHEGMCAWMCVYVCECACVDIEYCTWVWVIRCMCMQAVLYYVCLICMSLNENMWNNVVSCPARRPSDLCSDSVQVPGSPPRCEVARSLGAQLN